MQGIFANIVDYAGLFPPASCAMDEAVANYADYRRGEDRWMLGRLVVAASRLDELAESVIRQGLTPAADDPWGLSVVLGAHLPQERQRMAQFAGAEAAAGLRIEAVEVKVGSPGEAEVIGGALSDVAERYLEVPHQSSYGELVQAIASTGSFAKIRTGGVTPDAFPTPIQLTRFLIAVSRIDLPFKATAGLHHAVRGTYPLTYAADSDQHLMYGFVNLLLATAVLRAGGEGETAQAILEERDPTAFRRDGTGLWWRDQHATLDELAATRMHGFRGFGSCSFREPVDELAAGVGA
jgi:hypothetical protein